MLDRALDCLDRALRDRVAARLARWVDAQVGRALPSLGKLSALSRDASATPGVRAIAGAVEAGAGVVARAAMRQSLDTLDGEGRRRLRQAGVTIGALDLFDPRALRPGPTIWRRLLLAVDGAPIGDPPPDGVTVLERGATGATLGHGFRSLGSQAVRVDLVERIARAAHDARQGRKPFVPDPALATSIGLQPATLDRLMAELGFRPIAQGEARAWVWRGRSPAKRVAPPSDNAFAALAGLMPNG